MAETGLQIGINFDSEDDARALADDIRAQGASAQLEPGAGLLPLGVLLWIVIPPGIGLLALVANRIAHSWLDHGTLIDARGDGPVQVVEQKGLDYGTVVLLTRDGDRSERSDLPDGSSVGDYIGKALTALGGGASASEADAQAAATASKDGTGRTL